MRISRFKLKIWKYLDAKECRTLTVDDVAEWSKAPASGAGPKGRGFESHCRHNFWLNISFLINIDFPQIFTSII